MEQITCFSGGCSFCKKVPSEPEGVFFDKALKHAIYRPFRTYFYKGQGNFHQVLRTFAKIS